MPPGSCNRLMTLALDEVAPAISAARSDTALLRHASGQDDGFFIGRDVDVFAREERLQPLFESS